MSFRWTSIAKVASLTLVCGEQERAETYARALVETLAPKDPLSSWLLADTFAIQVPRGGLFLTRELAL